MTSMKNCERILEAIDQLRGRKARPDIQRICNYLFRRFAMNSAEAKADLEWCVSNNIVLRVEYKGSISYRNPAKKFAQMRPYKPRGQLNKSADDKNNLPIKQFGELLTNAIGELIVQEPDYLEFGVPSNEIVNNILAKDSVRYTKKYLNILLDKEAERGGLIKMENGNFLMGPNKDDDDTGKEQSERVERNDSWKTNKTETEIVKQAPMVAKTERDKCILWKSDQTETDIIKQKPIVSTKIDQDKQNDSDYFVQFNHKAKKRASFEQKKELRPSHFESMESGNSTDDKKSDNGSLRIGGRRKRAKKVFDPSDSHVPKKRGRPIGSLNKSTIEKQLARMNDEMRPDSRTSSTGREQGGVCSVCHIQNKRGPNDRMVPCRECSNKAHLSCLNGEDMMLKMYPDNTWQCPHCKTCVVCFETADAGVLIVCSVCADGYHPGCHEPRIEKSRSSNKWLCNNCHMPDELKINQIQSNIGNSFSSKSNSIFSSRKSNYSENNDPSPSDSGSSSPSYNSPPLTPTPPQLSPQNSHIAGMNSNGRDSPDQDAESEPEKDSDYEDNIDPSIPDATHWTPDEVANYFAQWFPEESKIFKEQEIDGRSLLLLKRIDVLTNLNLKLGPALKIYRHVVKLQMRRDDPKYYWL